jgi:hypothetical protein
MYSTPKLNVQFNCQITLILELRKPKVSMLVLPKHIDMFYISMLLKLDSTGSQTGSVGNTPCLEQRRKNDNSWRLQEEKEMK